MIRVSLVITRALNNVLDTVYVDVNMTYQHELISSEHTGRLHFSTLLNMGMVTLTCFCQ